MAAALVVTDEMSFAREVALRLIYLEDGELIEAGPPSRPSSFLRTRPAPAPASSWNGCLERAR